MADQRITELDVLAPASAADVFPIVDVSDTSISPTGKTKQIRADVLFASPQPIGSNAPNTGRFTSLRIFPSAAVITEFSTDGTLSGDADTAVPTEQAVKTYVDNALSNLNPNKIWQDDSYVEVIDDGTNAGVITIVADGVEVASLSDANQIFGKASTTHLSISDGTAVIPVGSFEVFGMRESGIYVEFGATINEFSTDGTLVGNSNTALPTEQAVKTYVDSQIGGSNLNVFLTSSDSTATDGDAILVDTTAAAVNITLLPTANAKIIIKKITSDSNVVNVTTSGGLVDNQSSRILSSSNEAYTFICDGTDYYVI